MCVGALGPLGAHGAGAGLFLRSLRSTGTQSSGWEAMVREWVAESPPRKSRVPQF